MISMPGGSKLKLLVTDNQALDPPIGGGRLRLYHLCKEWARTFAVTYVGAFDRPGPEYREQHLAAQFLEVLTPLTQVHFALEAVLRRLAGGATVMDVSVPLLMRFTPRFREILTKQSERAQAIVVAHPWVFPFVSIRSDQLLVYDAHNFEYGIKRSLLGGSLVGRYLVRKVWQVERDLCHQSGLILVCSAVDRDALAHEYEVDPAKIHLVPNGVDTAEVLPVSNETKINLKRQLALDDKKVVLFVGSAYGPNDEAVEYIVQRLAIALKDLLFLIVGSVRDSSTRRHVGVLPPNVNFTGVVDPSRKRTLYAAADVAINPMFSGSGTNMKMLDYMAAGLPVVSTPAGARGLDAQDGEHFSLAAAEQFPEAVQRLLSDTALQERLAQNGRKLVEEKYSWREIADHAARQIVDRLDNAVRQ